MCGRACVGECQREWLKLEVVVCIRVTDYSVALVMALFKKIYFDSVIKWKSVRHIFCLWPEEIIVIVYKAIVLRVCVWIQS